MATNVKQPVQARSQEKREAILKSALRTFAEHGFDGARMRDIAADAGVHHPAIKYYFENKEGLWRSAVEWMFENIDREVFTPLYSQEYSDAMERLERFIELYVSYCAHHPEHARITIAESNRGGERLRWLVDKFVRQSQLHTFEIYNELIQDGKLPAVDTVSLMYSIVGMCQLPFVISKEAEVSLGIDMTSEKMVESHIATVKTLVLGHHNKTPM